MDMNRAVNRGFFDGETGDFTWDLDGEGTLTVSGSGRMPDLRAGNHAESMWQDVRDSVRKVQLGEGITEIGTRNFEDCVNLTEVHLPSTLRRIRAYAFRGCTALGAVEAQGREFKYVHEKRADDTEGEEGTEGDENALIFGTESFARTPWAREHFGEFYCLDGFLNICFSGQDSIRIPEGVCRICNFAFANVHADELVLPDSLESVEDFVFVGAEFETMVMPDRMDTPMRGLPGGGWVNGKPGKSRRKVPFLYKLDLKKTKYAGYKQFLVSRKKKTDGMIWGRKLVDVGDSLSRRLRRGGVLIGIQYSREHRIETVKSFVWLENASLFEEYLMYPVMLENGEIEPYRDSFTYQEKEAFLDGFSDMDAEGLIREGAIRYPQPETSEEWFWSTDRGDYGGPLEMELLQKWMEDHPGFVIDTMEENMEKDRYRMFVPL